VLEEELMIEAERGDAESAYLLGLSYATGYFVDRDYEAAVYWIRKAAEKELGWAQAQLGWMLAAGLHMERDDAEAVRWLRAAAKEGVPPAYGSLAFMYASGRGVPADLGEAVHWYVLALQSGSAHVRESLSIILPLLPADRVSVDRIALREDTSVDATATVQLDWGDTVHVLAIAGTWAKVYVAEGHRVGWLPVAALEVTAPLP
jgi:hypothetical protein